MRGDNLTISIGADTTKLQADLSIAQQAVKNFKREMDKASRESLKTGDRTAVDSWSEKLTEATRNAAALNRQLAETNRTIVSTGQAISAPAWAAGARGIKALSEEFKTLARTVIPFAGAAGGVLEFVNLLGKAKDELLRLNRESIATGFSPTALKAVSEANEDAGGTAEGTSRMMMGLARAMAQVRQEARNTGKEIGSEVKVLRGMTDVTDEAQQTQQRVRELMSGVNVGRGGIINKLEVKDAATAFAVLQVPMEKFKDTMEDNDRAFDAVIAGFERLEKTGRTDLGNLVAQALNLGRNLKEAIPALRELGAEGLRKAMDALKEQGRDPNKERIQGAKDYQKALKDIGDQYEALSFAFLKAFGPTAVEILRNTKTDLEEIAVAAGDIKKFLTGQWDWPEPPDWLKMFLLGRQAGQHSGLDADTNPVEAGAQKKDLFGIQAPMQKFIKEDWPALMESFKNQFFQAEKSMQQTNKDIFTQIAEFIAEKLGAPNLWDRFISGAKSALDSVKGFFSGVIEGAKSAVSAASNLPTVVRGGQSTGDGSGPPPPTTEGGVRVLRGYAPGGLISGPGTGTSDSILARLSTGEFVINAAATAKFLPLLRMINDGMRAPLLPRTSFASGGLVMATDAYGTPVHLHFDGQEFPLRTDATVAESLMRTARAKQMLSAGRKPSWAGGRRYGG